MSSAHSCSRMACSFSREMASILLITTRRFRRGRRERISWSRAPTPTLASSRSSVTSTSRFASYAVRTIYSPSLFLGVWIPGVSKKTIWYSPRVRIPVTLLRVVCAFPVAIATFCPTNAFMSVDFPTFGLPKMDTNPERYSLFIPRPPVADAPMLRAAFGASPFPLPVPCGHTPSGAASRAP